MPIQPARAACTIMLLSLFAAACGKSSGDKDGAVEAPETSAAGKPTATAAATQAAQQGALAGHDAGATDGSVAGGGGSMYFAAEQAMQQLALGLGAITGQVRVGGCDVALDGNTNVEGGGLSVDANITFDPNSCRGKIKMSGTETVQVTVGSGGDPNGRVLKVTDALTRTLADDDTIAISSLDPAVGYTFQLTASGLPADGLVTLHVLLNQHRKRTAASGKVVFEHAITTDADAALEVQNAYAVMHSQATATSRTLVSGTVHVHHLLAKFMASHAMNNVTFDLTGSCACPSSGSMVQTVVTDDGSGGFTRTYTFTGCGEASVVTSASTLAGTADGTATVTMADCAM